MTQSNQEICRWGILSTATIGRKNWQAIKLSGNGRLVAVASRRRASAEQYITECQAAVPFDEPPRAVEGYNELLAADDIDAVYIPLPTGMRKEWVIRAAEAGKHVMCEKPCAVSFADLSEMCAACEANGVQFMDGVMYMHSKRLGELRSALDATGPESIGRIKRIATQFSFCGDDEFQAGNIRTDGELEPFGCLGDLGWYTIRFTLWVMNYEMPKQVSGRMLRDFQRDAGARKVPMEFSGELFFDNDVSASFYNSFVTGHQQWAHVSGTRGHAHLADFVLPYNTGTTEFRLAIPDFQVEDCDFTMIEHGKTVSVTEPANSASQSQETILFRRFAELANSGKPDDHWPKIALQTQRIMDACYESAVNGSRLVDIS